MAGTKDIKNFTKFPSLSDNDLILGSKTSLGGSDAAIAVSDFKKQVSQDVEPTINENGYWVVNGVNTGKKAEGATPVLEGGSTTTGEPDTQASSSIVRSGETPEGLPRYIISLTIPRGSTGNDGKTPQFKIGTVKNGDDASASLSFDGEDLSGNPVYKINLVLPKGEIGNPGVDGSDGIDGKTPKFEAGPVTTLDPGEKAIAQITFKQNDTDGSPIYTISLSIPKGDVGDSGKTPILESVNATSGETPSGSFTKNGVDEEGNPKYILNLTTPKGKDGQPAVFEQGITTTLDPSEEARVEVVENGETPEGNPKYILNFFVPRGQTGPAGSGTGNVLVDAAGLVSGKKYLFVPDSDNSSSGTFMEYVEPAIPTKTSDLTNNSGFITKAVNDLTNYYLKSETYTKEEVQSLISAINSVTLQKVDSLPEPGGSNVIYLVPKSGSGNDIYDEYIFIDGKPEHIGSTQVDLSNYVQEAPKDGKTYGRNNGAWSEIVASNQYLDVATLFPEENGTLSDENYQKVVDAVNKGITTARIETNPDGFGPITINNSTEIYGITTNILAVDPSDRSIWLTIIAIIINKSDKTYTLVSNRQSLQNTGSGTKYLSDNGEYLTPPTATSATAGYMSAEDKKRVDDIVNFGTGSNAVTTLVNIPTSKRLVKATLSSASNLSINESARALNVGEEIYLDCNPTASFTQPIPTTGSFRSMSGSSITTTSGVPFEMSILKIATSGVMYSITVKEKD